MVYLIVIHQKARLLLGNYLKKNYCAVYGKAQNLRRLLTKSYDDVLEKFDVVAMPTTPYTAPKLPTQADWMKGKHQLNCQIHRIRLLIFN